MVPDAPSQSPAAWITARDTTATIADIIVTTASVGNGGMAWAARQRRPVYVAPSAQPMVRAMRAGHGQLHTVPAATRGR